MYLRGPTSKGTAVKRGRGRERGKGREGEGK